MENANSVFLQLQRSNYFDFLYSTSIRDYQKRTKLLPALKFFCYIIYIVPPAMKICLMTLILFLFLLLASTSAGEVVDYPPQPASTSIMEVMDAFWTLVATVRENWIFVLVVIVLYIFWRLRRRARMQG